MDIIWKWGCKSFENGVYPLEKGVIPFKKYIYPLEELHSLEDSFLKSYTF